MPSFDISSEVDKQEVTNAVDQVRREIAQRYDFKGSKAELTWDVKELITILADDDMKLTAIQEMLKQKLAKRNVGLNSIKFEDPEVAGGDMRRQLVKVKQGLESEECKRMTKIIKDEKFKVTTQIQESKLRVTGKKRDDLQTVIQHLKTVIKDIDLQFGNFRE